MERKFNATGERRKEMVKVISGIVGMKAVYMRMPTCAYAISNFTVSKEGALTWDERSSGELVEKVLAGLAQAGFTAEPEETAEAQAEPEETAEAQAEPQDSAEEAAEETAADIQETAAGEEAAEPQEGIGLTVSLPRESFTDAALENLHRLVDAKAALIKKALAVESLPVGAGAGKERPADNEKYAFRCFLLRLGFIGEEYKGERKVLLKNLSGNGSFKSGARKGAADNDISE